MFSFDDYVRRQGETSNPSMYDDMVWDTLTEEQKVSVARLAHGGVELRESRLEEEYEKGFNEGHREGHEEGEREALDSSEMTDKLRERLRELLGVELRDLVREVLTKELRSAQPIPSGDDPERVLPGHPDVQPPDGP